MGPYSKWHLSTPSTEFIQQYWDLIGSEPCINFFLFPEWNATTVSLGLCCDAKEIQLDIFSDGSLLGI